MVRCTSVRPRQYVQYIQCRSSAPRRQGKHHGLWGGGPAGTNQCRHYMSVGANGFHQSMQMHVNARNLVGPKKNPEGSGMVATRASSACPPACQPASLPAASCAPCPAMKPWAMLGGRGLLEEAEVKAPMRHSPPPQSANQPTNQSTPHPATHPLTQPPPNGPTRNALTSTRSLVCGGVCVCVCPSWPLAGGVAPPAAPGTSPLAPRAPLPVGGWVDG